VGTGAFLGRRFQVYLCQIIAQEDWFCQTKSPAGHSLGQARTEKTAGERYARPTSALKKRFTEKGCPESRCWVRNIAAMAQTMAYCALLW